MITIVEGTPGSGKTFWTVQHCIYDWVLRGKEVWLNFGLTPSWPVLLACRTWRRFLPYHEIEKMAKDYSKRVIYYRSLDDIVLTRASKESQRLLVIDEGGLRLNSRNWKENHWIKLFSQHRKAGWDIILIAQRAEMLDRQIRDLCEEKITIKSMKNFRINLFLFTLPLKLPVGLAIRKWLGSKVVLDRDVFGYSKLVCRIYDTFEVIDELEPGAKVEELDLPDFEEVYASLGYKKQESRKEMRSIATTRSLGRGNNQSIGLAAGVA